MTRRKSNRTKRISFQIDPKLLKALNDAVRKDAKMRGEFINDRGYYLIRANYIERVLKEHLYPKPVPKPSRTIRLKSGRCWVEVPAELMQHMLKLRPDCSNDDIADIVQKTLCDVLALELILDKKWVKIPWQ